MKEKLKSVYVRVTEKEKIRIQNKAKKCGLSVSEYLRKRALGYSPKALLPDTFYVFSEKLGALYEQLKIQGADKLCESVLSLLDEIQKELLFPDKSKEFLEDDIENNEPVCTSADSE